MQQPPEGNGLAVASMVLGICTVVFCWVPFFNWLLALLAIIFGAIGLGKAKRVNRGKGAAVAGLVTGVVGALLGVAIFVLAVMAVKKGGQLIVSGAQRADAELTVQNYANDAYPQWSAAHPDKACPDSISELDQYLGQAGAHGRDPWGHSYKMFCGANLPAGARGLAVMSLGPDGQEGTADDIKSW